MFASKSSLFCLTSIHSHALLDSGASTCFIDKSFVRAHNISTVHTSQPISIEAIDGRVLSSGAVTEATIPLVLQFGAHQEEVTFYLIGTPRHRIVLGLSWLETHNSTVDWCSRSITFPVRPIPIRSRHSLDSVEFSLVATLDIVLGDVTIHVNNLPTDIATFSIFSKSVMPISYRIIAPTIGQSNSKLASIHHSVLSTGYLNPNLRLSTHIWPTISRRASFNSRNHQFSPG